MRKFFSKDFNNVTSFIKRKRYKSQQYFFLCLKQYLNSRFNEFADAILINNQKRSNTTSDFNELVFFLGCLLYPKDMDLALSDIGTEMGDDKRDKWSGAMSQKYKEIHSYLYSFSLEKLNNLVNLKYFAYFYSHYFQ